jgi:hypothetical protein
MSLNNINKGLALVILFAMLLLACGGTIETFKKTESSSGSNQMGMNIDPPVGYLENRLYADLIHTSSDFTRANTSTSLVAPAELDSDGWPKTDFSFAVWDNTNMHGTYTLIFSGQATVSCSCVGSTVALTYDSASNTSTGKVVVANASKSAFNMTFTNTINSLGGATNTGVTSIKLMRPLTPGSTQSYSPSTLFTTPIKVLLSKFSVIRYMDYLATNSNLQTNWTDRALPSWASYNRNPGGTYGWAGIGGPLEHTILLSNETGKDAWINIPVLATDAYITNVANLFKYGSDGVNPYTSIQANPKYPPLNANLKLYVEFSNELWNNAGPFNQVKKNCQAASDELAAHTTSSPLDWDGGWDGTSTYINGVASSGWNYTMCVRQTTKRSVEMSNIFRSVFGDAAMGTQVRPVLMSQLTNSAAILYEQTKMMLHYYNNMDGSNKVATPHPPSYYFYGAGGSGYYWPATTVTTVDAIFADPGMTPSDNSSKGFGTYLKDDIKYVSAMGLKRIAYEGGPSLDKTGGARDAASALAVNDYRMKDALVGMHNTWSSNGGDLLVYLTATGDYQWGFTPDVHNLVTPKLAAVDALNATGHAPLTYGTPVPGTALGGGVDACSRSYTCTNNAPPPSTDGSYAAGTSFMWGNYTFRSDKAALWTIDLAFTSATGNPSVAVYVDGVLVIAQNTTGGKLSYSAGTLGAGLHGVIVRAVTGSFLLKSVTVALN